MRSIMETHILNFVSVNYGLKGTDIVKKIMELNLQISHNEILDIIFDMVQDGRLVEIELVFPNNVSKSFLVLKDTKINILRMRMR